MAETTTKFAPLKIFAIATLLLSVAAVFVMWHGMWLDYRDPDKKVISYE